MPKSTHKQGWLDTKTLSKELGLTAEQKARLEQNVAEWDAKVEPLLAGIRACRTFTAFPEQG